MDKCEQCKHFYTCDNMGWWEECQAQGYPNFEKREEDEDEEE